MAILSRTSGINGTKQIDTEPSVVIGVKWVDIPDRINFYCGKGSVLGNPYAHKNMSKEERDVACDKYHDYFYMNVNEGEFKNTIGKLIKLLNHGYKLNLQCFCKDKRCHCETIKEYLDNETN